EAVPHEALTHHRDGRVRVHRPRPPYEEELGVRVVDVVRREGGQALAVEREPPARDEAGVVVEEPLGGARRGVDVAAAIADVEGAPLETADVRAHGPGD